jgi:hypothetical protein
VFEEFDPDFVFLSLIDHRLPQLVMRAILPRWLNLSSLLVPVLALSLLAVLAREKRSWLAALGLTVFLVLILDKERWRWFFVPDISSSNRTDFAQIYLLLIPAFVIVSKMKSYRGRGILDRNPSVIVAVALAFFFVAKIKDLAVPAYAEQRPPHETAEP